MRPVIGWCPDPLPTVTRSLGETRSALPTSQSKPAACGRPRDFCYRFQGLCQHSAPAAAAANSLASSGRFPVPVLTLGVPSTIHHPPSHAPPLSTSSGSLYHTIQTAVQGTFLLQEVENPPANVVSSSYSDSGAPSPPLSHLITTFIHTGLIKSNEQEAKDHRYCYSKCHNNHRPLLVRVCAVLSSGDLM